MRINVTVKTGKNESKVIKKDFADYEVWLKAQPVRGAANKELIQVLADYFSVKPYNLRIVKGLTLPRKMVDLTK
jgi:uncharacterized protein YggU (UPF0235/DUF167 family)